MYIKIKCKEQAYEFYSFSDYAFNFVTKFTHAIEHLYCLVNACYMFLRSLIHLQGELLLYANTRNGKLCLGP